jgi:proteasome accessory factor B
VRRIERLVNLVAALLDTRRPLTAEEIRTRIAGYGQEGKEAFRRTFERDKQALREMGIPLELRPTEPFGEPDGYVIPKERYYLPDPGLEPDELAALRIAAQAVLGRSEEAGMGLLKLSLGPEGNGGAAPQVITGTSVGVEDPLLSSLYAALVDRKPVRFSYVDAHGRRSARRVEPWTLVHRAGHWYLVGRDVDARERRTFKLTRIEGVVATLDDPYEAEPPPDAAASVGAEAWEFGSTEVTEARVRFSSSARWWAEQNLAHLRAREADGGGLEVDMSVGNDAALLGWVIGWGGEVIVVAPPSLARRLRVHLGPWLEGASG